MKEANNNIPQHWEMKKLGEIGDIVAGGTPSTAIAEYWEGKISWISPADLSGYTEKFILRGRKSITESGLKNSSARIIPKGSVLFSSRAPIGYVAIAGKEVCTNQGFKSIVPINTVSSEYLYYFLKASKQRAEEVASGTTFKEISLKAFSQLTIPLPPLPEQVAIVNKIEELFSELENGKEQLLTAQRQLKIYRQSLLKAAFEGKLSGLGFVGLKDDRITEKSDKNDILKSSNPKNPNSDSEFPKKIESITPIELQAGIIAMVIDAHTKNPKYVNKLNHVKCEKISDLVERKLGISLGRNAVKDAAGPDDYSHLKKVEHRATMAGYFQVIPQPIGHAYKPMRNLQKAIDKAKEVLSEHDLNSVNELIKQFLPFELEHAELVATIYAGWNNLLLLGKNPTNEEIIYESRENWSKRKLTINRQRFFDALKWMRDHNYIPEGKGKPVLKSEEVNTGKNKKFKND